MTRHTHTYATLTIPAHVHANIVAQLKEAGYDVGDGITVPMQGIAVEPEPAKGETTKFKEFVHTFLDKRGVPHDPDPKHTREHGCRIDGRLRWVFTHLYKLLARVHRDGGHRTAEIGLERSVDEADHKVATLNAMQDGLIEERNRPATAMAHPMMGAPLSAYPPNERPATPAPRPVRTMDDLRLYAVKVAEKRQWPMDVYRRGVYMHLEVSEFIEAMRGKGKHASRRTVNGVPDEYAVRLDTEDEAADVLITWLVAVGSVKLNVPDIEAMAWAKLEALEHAPPYPGEMRLSKTEAVQERARQHDRPTEDLGAAGDTRPADERIADKVAAANDAFRREHNRGT